MALVAAVAWVPSLAQELPQAKERKKRNHIKYSVETREYGGGGGGGKKKEKKIATIKDGMRQSKYVNNLLFM